MKSNLITALFRQVGRGLAVMLQVDTVDMHASTSSNLKYKYGSICI